jgi:hypothetical protein
MFGKLAAIQLVIILLMAGAGYAYFRHAEGVINGLHEDKAKLELSVHEQEQTIEAQQASSRRQNEENLHLQQRLSDAEDNRRRLEALLRRRDLEAMARANSADLEMRMNRATIRAFRDIETLTTPRDRSTPTPPSPTVTAQPVATENLPSNVQPPPRPPRPSAPAQGVRP